MVVFVFDFCRNCFLKNITIENKIDADLYNYLYIYKNHIDNKYSEIKDKHFYVLTAHTIDESKLKKADPEKAFEVKKYEQLFTNVESLLDQYASIGDPQYLTFMKDFIQTIKNKIHIMEKTESDIFFAKNRIAINKLIEQYKLWKDHNIAWLLEEVNNEETEPKWEIYEGWILQAIFRKEYAIGIVSNFEPNAQGNPYGIFCIYITTWDKNSWKLYEEGIRKECCKKYPNLEFDKAVDNHPQNDPNRVYLHLPKIERKNFNDEESYHKQIINKLNECYVFLKELTDNIDK